MVNNRTGNNQNTYPPPGISVNTITIQSHGTVFAQLTDSTWRCMAGLQPNPSTGPTSSPVPIAMTATPTDSYLLLTVPYTSPLNTVVGSLAMTLSDGTVVVPSNGEVALTNDVGFPLGLTCTYSSPNLVTQVTGMTQGTADSFIIQVTRNGTTYCLTVAVYFA